MRDTGAAPGGRADRCHRWHLLDDGVFESIGGRHPQPVVDAYPRRHVSVDVGGYRFDRGAADVNADCEPIVSRL